MNTPFQITIVRPYRAAKFLLYIDPYKERPLFAPRSRGVKENLWSLIKAGIYLRKGLSKTFEMKVKRAHNSRNLSQERTE